MGAVETGCAGDREGEDDDVAYFVGLDRGADGGNGANGFVALFVV